MKGNGRGLIQALTLHLHGGTEENQKNRMDAWPPGRDSNLVLPEFKSTALPLDNPVWSSDNKQINTRLQVTARHSTITFILQLRAGIVVMRLVRPANHTELFTSQYIYRRQCDGQNSILYMCMYMRFSNTIHCLSIGSEISLRQSKFPPHPRGTTANYSSIHHHPHIKV